MSVQNVTIIQYAWVKNIYSSDIPCSIPLNTGDARVSSCPPLFKGAPGRSSLTASVLHYNSRTQKASL